MRSFTITAFAGAALLNGAAFAAQDHNARAYIQDGILSVQASFDDAGGPARKSLDLGAYFDEDHTNDFGAGAKQTDTNLKLSLAFPAEAAYGAEFLYVDVLDPATGFQLYELTVRVGDLQVFINDYTDEFGDQNGDATGDFGPNLDPGHKKDPGQDTPIGNPYGDDVLFPPTNKIQTLYPIDPALDFGDGSGGATATNIPVDGPGTQFDPSLSTGDDDPGNPDYDPPIGNPYGDDAINPWNGPFQDANSYSDPSSNTGDGTVPAGTNPFAPGDGDLGDGSNADDFTLTSAPSSKNALSAANPGNGSEPSFGTPDDLDETDCNGNGTPDHLEISDDPGLDTDNDGRIDRCTARGDLDNDGVVGVLDLVALIMNWGTCLDSCEGDLTIDGAVNEDDVAVLFNHWTN